MIDHDVPDWYREKVLADIEESDRTLEDIDHHELHGGFLIARELLQSKVEYRRTTIYDLPQHVPEPIDLAFLGSVIVHLRDPVAALEAIRKVLRPGGRLIAATSCEKYPEPDLVRFVGKAHECAWWSVGPEAFVKMCTMAGFRDVSLVGSHRHDALLPPHSSQEIAVLHAIAP